MDKKDKKGNTRWKEEGRERRRRKKSAVRRKEEKKEEIKSKGKGKAGQDTCTDDNRFVCVCI